MSDLALDLREFVAMLRERWLWLLAGVALATLLAVVYVLRTADQFEVRTVLASNSADSLAMSLSSVQSSLGALGGLVNFGGPADKSQEAIFTLTSFTFLGDFIERHRLMPVLFMDQWDQAAGEWKEEYRGDKELTLRDGYRFLSEELLEVIVNPKSGLVTVKLRWTDRVQAAEWLNALITDLNRYMQARAVEQHERNIAYLRGEIDQTDLVSVQSALNAVVERELESAMLANTREDFAFTVLEPAFVPDADESVWPKSLLILFGANVVAVALVVGFATLRFAWSRESG